MKDICAIWAYYEIKESGVLTKQRARYLSIFSEAYPESLCMAQVEKILTEKFGAPPSSRGYGGRVSELEARGFLVKAKKDKSTQTTRTVNYWKWTGRKKPLPSRMVWKECSECAGKGHKQVEEFYEDGLTPQGELF